MKIEQMQPEDRPLQRLINKGPQALSNPELLAIILGKDFNWNGYHDTAINIANRVFSRYNIKQLSQASVGELKKIFGIGIIRAAHIQSIFELGRRLASYTEEFKPKIETANDVFKILGPEMQSLEQESTKIILLDSTNRLIKVESISLGTLNANIIHPRELFKPVIDNNVSSIIVVHNHPSGDPMPSIEDVVITKKIIKAGQTLGIEIKDHVIIGCNKYFSFTESKYLEA
jgi:DNA repair protein RadC